MEGKKSLVKIVKDAAHKLKENDLVEIVRNIRGGAREARKEGASYREIISGFSDLTPFRELKMLGKDAAYGVGKVHCLPTAKRKLEKQYLEHLKNECSWDPFFYKAGAYGSIAGYLVGTGLLCGMFGPAGLLPLGIPAVTQLSSHAYEGLRKVRKKDTE